MQTGTELNKQMITQRFSFALSTARPVLSTDTGNEHNRS